MDIGEMVVHDVEQGSDAWLALRLEKRTASEASAAAGKSRFTSREQLLDAKKGWKANPHNSFKEALFEKAHENEDSARKLEELDQFDDLPPIVASRVIDGIELFASFDGLAELTGRPWEHKEWNEILAENVRNGVLEADYWIQLEQQGMVAQSPEVDFTVSDGTAGKRVKMIYACQPDRQQYILDVWRQFDKDEAEHELVAKKEAVPARAATQLPIIHCKVEGSKIISNIGEVIPQLEELASREMLRVLETDQDFTTKAAFNKSVKDARAKLKQIHAATQNEFKDWAKFADNVATFDSILQKVQSHGEGQVKTDKAKRKQEIISQAKMEVNQHAADCTKRVSPALMADFVANDWDFEESLKGMSSLDKMRDKIGGEVANIKVRLTNIADLVSANLLVLRNLAKDHEFLFNDFRDIINQSTEAFTAIVKTRIAEHEAAEQQKRDDEREKMRLEEEAKAKHKADATAKMSDFTGLITQAQTTNTLAGWRSTLEELSKICPSSVSVEIYGNHTSDVMHKYTQCKNLVVATIADEEARIGAEVNPGSDEPAITGFDQVKPGDNVSEIELPLEGYEADVNADGVSDTILRRVPAEKPAEEVLATAKPNNLTQAKHHSHDPKIDKISSEFNDALGMYCERWYLNDGARSELYKLVNQYL